MRCAVSRVVVFGEIEGGGNVPGCFGVDYAVEQAISTCNDGDGGSEITALESAHEQSERESQ